MARRSTTLRWTAVAAVLFVLIWGIADLIQRFAEAGRGPAPSQWVLPVLVIAIVVLALGLAGVLIRNLVRLILDRRRGILGSRIRTTLVFFFLAFVLFPALVLFYGAAAVIRVTVEAMVKTPVEEVTRGAREIAEGWTDSMRSQCRSLSIHAATEAERFLDERAGPRAGLSDFAQSRLTREAVDLFAVFWGGEAAAVAVDGGRLRQGDGPPEDHGVDAVLGEGDREGVHGAGGRLRRPQLAGGRIPGLRDHDPRNRDGGRKA